MSSIVLVDTSVWIQFFQGDEDVVPRMDRLLDCGVVFLHSLGRYEILLGGASREQEDLLNRTVRPDELDDDEVWMFVAKNRLRGSGIGWVDAATLASAHSSGSSLWTFDKSLAAAARKIGLPQVRIPRKPRR